MGVSGVASVGAVAQLGERLNGIQEVVGSIPISSTRRSRLCAEEGSVLDHSSRPVVLSDRQGFDRRWFAANLQAVYVPTHPERVADCVTAAIKTYGKDVKVASGRHCYENFVYNGSTKAVIDMSALNQVGFDATRNA